MDHLIEFLHEFSSWRDGVVLEVLLTVCRALLVVAIKSFNKLFVISCAFEPSGSLVVHFGSWSNTIQSQEDHFSGFEQVDNSIDVVEHLNPNFLKLLGHNLRLEYHRIIL